MKQKDLMKMKQKGQIIIKLLEKTGVSLKDLTGEVIQV